MDLSSSLLSGSQAMTLNVVLRSVASCVHAKDLTCPGLISALVHSQNTTAPVSNSPSKVEWTQSANRLSKGQRTFKRFARQRRTLATIHLLLRKSNERMHS